MKLAGISSVGNELHNYSVKPRTAVEDSKQVGTSMQEPEQYEKAAHEKDKQTLDRSELGMMTDELNKFMQMANANIQFQLHEETGRLMVQVVDTAKQEVLKEFPPRDMLDMIAKIREYVGMLLDERA